MSFAPNVIVDAAGCRPIGLIERPPISFDPAWGVVAAWMVHTNNAASIPNLVNPGTFDLIPSGAPAYVKGGAGATCSGSAFYETTVPSYLNMTLAALMEVAQAVNSGGNFAAISSYGGGAPTGDELGFASGSVTFTGTIVSNVLTVSSISSPLLDVGVTITGSGVSTKILAFAGGTGGNGNYVVQATANVGPISMIGTVSLLRAISQEGAVGNRTAAVPVSGEAVGSQLFCMGTMSAAGGNNEARVYKGNHSGSLIEGVSALSATTRTANATTLRVFNDRVTGGGPGVGYMAIVCNVVNSKAAGEDMYGYLAESFWPAFGLAA